MPLKMRSYHHINVPKRSPRAGATLISLGATLTRGFLLGVALLSLAAASGALADPGGPPTPPAQGSLLAVSGSSGSTRSVARRPRSPQAARAEAFVGMTRRSERRKIESIDPKSWLSQFGEVQALATR